MALSIDVNTSKAATVAATSVTSNSFSTTAPNELILVLASSADDTGLAISGGGLTWHTLQDAPGNASDNAYIFYAWAANILTNQTVKVQGTNSQQWQITVLSFIGADAISGDGSSAIGANNQATGVSGTQPSINLTTTRNNSWIFGSIGYGANVVLTAGTNQTIFAQNADTINGGKQATIEQNAVTPTKGTSVTTNVTNTTANWAIAAVEILPAFIGAPQMSMMGVGM